MDPQQINREHLWEEWQELIELIRGCAAVIQNEETAVPENLPELQRDVQQAQRKLELIAFRTKVYIRFKAPR